MFLKAVYKNIKSTGERVTNYRLVESYRFDNTVRHQTILHVGTLSELPDVEQKRALSIRINELVKESHTGIQSLFIPEEVVEQLAQKLFLQIIEKERLDIAAGKDFHRIDTDSVKNKNIREAGTEWLCCQALEQLGIPAFLKSEGWAEEQVQFQNIQFTIHHSPFTIHNSPPDSYRFTAHDYCPIAGGMSEPPWSSLIFLRLKSEISVFPKRQLIFNLTL